MKRGLFFALLLVACATTNKNGPAAGKEAKSDDNVVCSEVSDTGSMFTHTECKPREDKDAETDSARRALQSPKAARDMPSSGARPAGGGR